MTSDTAAKLRAIPSLTGTAPAVDLEQLPDEPIALFREWLDAAIAAVHPAAALSIRWQPLMRTVRLRGPVVEATPQESGADLAARSEAARSAVAPGDWRLWRIQPKRVEFWQGRPTDDTCASSTPLMMAGSWTSLAARP